MRTKLHRRFWIDAVLGSAAGALTLLTLVWRDWIEIVLRVDPDQHSGFLEWLVVGVLIVVAVLSGGLAHHELRRAACVVPEPALGDRP